MNSAHQGHHPSRKTCRVCDVPLNVHQAARGQLCDNIGCRNQWASRMAMRRDRRHERNEHLARSLAHRAIEILVRENRIQRRGHYEVATVPASRKSLRPANRERQQRYREHFEQLLLAWQEQPDEAGPVEAPTEAAAEPLEDETPSALFGQACATCRGNCCSRGGTHAFQDLATLRRWFALHPDATGDDCREAYFSHLKTGSVEGSCVFHGSQGCELPRDWRADMCNSWICPSLQRIRKNHELRRKPVTIIVALEPGAAIRVNVVRSQTGERLEPEVELTS
jgi:hypothetical protein